MPFEFIDNKGIIDRAARKRIRTHAATGKNANRTLTRSSKAIVLKDNATTPFYTPATIRRAHRSTNDEPPVAQIERPVSDGVPFPITVPARSKGLVREALFFFSGARYSPELDDALENPDHMASVWARYFFLDESCACPHERLMSSKEAASDMTIAIIVVMSLYERLQGHYERGYVHVQGLRRMVELRGGVKTFSTECFGVIQKVLRADLEYALQLGSRTLFGLEGIEFLRLLRLVCIDDGRKRDQMDSIEVGFLLQKRLRTDLWTTFTDMRSRRKLGAEEFHNTIILFGYCLLQISPLNSSSESDASLTSNMNALEDAVHLGLIAFLVTFLRGLDHRIADQSLLSHRLRLAIQKLLLCVQEGPESQAVDNVLLWTLFIGTVHCNQAVGLSTWENVKQVLANFPWVNALHDRTGITLCSTQRFLENPVQSNQFH
ncbi:hypothetical protein BDW62DRAFT_210677 [Aspergillus aurantiobrunneus]